LPADFRHFKVTLDIGGYAVSRVFGVEICHARVRGLRPGDQAARITKRWTKCRASPKATRFVRWRGCRRGEKGEKTDAMIAASLPAIEDCHDCADFILVPLLWSRAVHADKLDARRWSSASTRPCSAIATGWTKGQ
jgi:hypothetical protein